MKKQWCIISTGVLILLVVWYLAPRKRQLYCSEDLWTLAGDDFEGFDNETGIQSGTFIVPNYVHFLRVGEKMKEFNFIDTVVVLSALKNQKPEKIFFHTDQEFTGHFWNVLVHTEGFSNIVEFVTTELPSEIYGQKLNQINQLYHASDLLRIRLLLKYGGIFLDNDSYVVRSLDSFRKFEMVLGWDDGEYLGTQVLIAHKDARFLQLWLNSYKDNYWGNLWYYNAGVRPTEVVLNIRPELIHRVKRLFGVHDLRNQLFQEFWQDWKKQYTIHLLIRHIRYTRNYPYTMPEQFTVENVHNYRITLTNMVDEVFNYTLHKELLS